MGLGVPMGLSYTFSDSKTNSIQTVTKNLRCTTKSLQEVDPMGLSSTWVESYLQN